MLYKSHETPGAGDNEERGECWGEAGGGSKSSREREREKEKLKHHKGRTDGLKMKSLDLSPSIMKTESRKEGDRNRASRGEKDGKKGGTARGRVQVTWLT